MGDAVLSLPALRALRERFFNAHITVLARPWVAGLYRREAALDEIVPYPAASGAGLALKIRLARSLRRQHFDWALLFPNAFEAALVPWLARIPRRTGYDRDGRRRLLTEPIPPPRKGETPPHETFYYLELLRRAGVLERLPEPAALLLCGTEEARREGEGLFRALGLPPVAIGMSPGAQNSRAKQWLPERFAETAGLLAERLGAGVVIFGSPRERGLGRYVAEILRRNGHFAINLAGETGLSEFIALTAACRVFLTNDSGAMHVASALGVPTVAIFGPTEWFATAPGGPRSRIVREPVECSPCMLRDCPIDHRCMTRVTAAQVAQAALDLLK